MNLNDRVEVSYRVPNSAVRYTAQNCVRVVRGVANEDDGSAALCEWAKGPVCIRCETVPGVGLGLVWTVVVETAHGTRWSIDSLECNDEECVRMRYLNNADLFQIGDSGSATLTNRTVQGTDTVQLTLVIATSAPAAQPRTTMATTTATARPK